MTGSDPEATTALRAGVTDTGFLGNGEKRTLHRRRHLVLSTLDPPALGPASFLAACRGPAAPAPPLRSGREGRRRKEKTELTPSEPQNVFNADSLQLKGISYCERCCQSLLNGPARFCLMLNYYADNSTELRPTHACYTCIY